MLSLIKAIAYFICRPFDIVQLTIVRRYIDAQGHYIGELYEAGRMIGTSCDNLPLGADILSPVVNPTICYRKSFLDPLPDNTLRVGSLEPKDNANVQAYVATRRFCVIRVTVLNRFIEYVLQGNVKI